MISKLIKSKYTLAITIVVVANIIYPQGPSGYYSLILARKNLLYDPTLTEAISNISNFVPKNQTLVTPDTFSPTIQYFSGYPVKVPWQAYSEKSLAQYMSKNNLTYLVVIKGATIPVEALIPLFSNEGLPKLNDFQKIADIETNSSALYIYRRSQNSSINY